MANNGENGNKPGLFDRVWWSYLGEWGKAGTDRILAYIISRRLSRLRITSRDIIVGLLRCNNMPQEFSVLCCCTCGMYQVQQVKKSNKWSCKVCNSKQSVKKVYGMGSAADCRRHVQKLNMMKGQATDSSIVSCFVQNDSVDENFSQNISCTDDFEADYVSQVSCDNQAAHIPEIRNELSKGEDICFRNVSICKPLHHKDRKQKLLQMLEEVGDHSDQDDGESVQNSFLATEPQLSGTDCTKICSEAIPCTSEVFRSAKTHVMSANTETRHSFESCFTENVNGKDFDTDYLI